MIRIINLLVASLTISWNSFGQNLTIVWPKHNEVISDRTPLLSWNGMEGISNYQVSLSLDSTFNSGVQQFSTSLTSYQLTNNLISGTWFWKVNGLVNGQNILSNVGKFQVFEPSDIAGLKLWLRSDSVQVVNGKVVQWYDRSGNNFHAIQGLISQQPTFISYDQSLNHQSLLFDGADDFLSIASNTTLSSVFVFSNWSGNELTFPGLNGIISSTNPASYILVGSPGTTGFYNDGGGLLSLGGIRINSLITTNYNPIGRFKMIYGSFTNPTYIQSLNIGNDRGNLSRSWKGKIPEVIMYSTNISSIQIQSVEAYLRDRYAPPVNLGQDLIVSGFCDIVLEPSNKGYISYQWNNNASTPTISINNPGLYWLQTTDIFGRVTRDTIYVERPVYDSIQLSSQIICANDSVILTAFVPVGSYNFQGWSDGILNQTRIVNTAQTLSYTLSDINSCQYTSNTANFNIDSSLLNISLGPDTSLCSGNSIQLQNLPNGIINYLWNTGNTQPSQVIDTSGNYILEVLNSNNCSNTESVNILVSGLAPIISLNVNNSVCVGSSLSFYQNSSVLSPDSVTNIYWDFGNGQISIESSGVIEYDNIGIFNGSLTVNSSNGCTNTEEFTVEVFDLPVAQFDVEYTCNHSELEFFIPNYDLINANSVQWSISDGNTTQSSLSIQPNFSYVPNTFISGTLSVIDQFGCQGNTLINLNIPQENLISLGLPQNNLTLNNSDPIFFSWNDFPIDTLVNEYSFQISNSASFSSIIYQNQIIGNSLILNNALGPGVFYWRVKRCNSLTWSSYRVFNLITFDNSLKVWLRSDSVQVVNGKVTQWYDRSGNNNHAYQTNIGQQPNFVQTNSAINSPSILFDGSDDVLICSPSTSISSMFIFSNWSGNDSIFPNLNGLISSTNPSSYILDGYPGSSSFYNDGGGLLSLGGISNNSIYTTSYSPLDRFKITFGKFISSTLIQTLNIGNDRGNFTRSWKGNIPEIILFGSSLNNIQVQSIEAYLRDRYAPPVYLGADIQYNSGFCNLTLQPTAQIYTSYLWNTNATSPTISINNPGTYWLQTVDIFGRTSRDTIRVFRPVYDSIQLSNQIICAGESITVNAFVPTGNYSFVQWSDGVTTPTRVLNSVQTLSYTVMDNNSCQRTSNIATYTVDSSLQNITFGADTSLCSGNSIQLQNAPAGLTAYEWNTGNTQTIQTIDTSGIYILDVTNINNCQNRDTIEVTVIGTSPTLQFTFSDTLCQFSQGSYLDNSFVPNGNGTISSKTWFISNGDTLTASSGSFSIDTSGIFNVTLLIQTEEGCSSTATFPLVVHPKPIISFTTEKFCPYDAVEFTPFNSQLSTLSSQLWSFDDNTTSNSTNPTHVFGTTGTFNVSLQAQDINGCRDTVVQAVYIQPQPVADFSFTNTCELSVVNFANNSSIADTFSIVTNQWSYGDGTQATNPSIQKVYQEFGDYDVQLVVTANNGCQDTLSQTITIHPKPILGWQVGPACKNTWTTFENQSTIPMGSIAQTDWLVNLQYPLEGTSSAYKFVTTGVQYLNLTSTSDQGCTTDTLIIVNVQPEINAAYSVSPATVVADVPVVFTNNSIGGTSYEWNLGNGNIIQTTDAEPIEEMGFASSFIGDSVLTYLAIQNAIGCKDTAYHYVKVNEPRIDLAINQLFVQDINGFYKVGVELRNLGFVEITQTDLLLKLYNSSPILETETESLAPGESRIYLFNANPSAFVSTQDNEISYLCVEATSFNDYQLIETELSNNISCLNTEGGNFVLLPIYPNPTNDDITYTLIVSEESTITTFITDETGRIVQSSTALFASGLHTPTLSMRNLSAGVYYFHISDGVTSKTVKVLKN